MRRYDIGSGILLILSIIDFALAAPVLVQEKRLVGVDVVQMPKDVTTVLGRRGDEEIQKLVEEFFGTWGKPIESSDAHASSSSAPPGPDHGSTNVVQAPGPNQESSSANPGPLMEPSSPSSAQGAWGDPLSEDQYWSYKGDDEVHGPLYHTPASSEYGTDHELKGAHAPQPNPNSGPSEDSYFDVNYWFPPPQPRPASPKEFDGQAHENQAEHVQQPNPGPSADPDFDWNHWMNLEDPPPPRPASPKESGQAQESQVENVQQPNPGPSPTDPEDPSPPPRPVSSKPSNPKSSSTNSGFNWKKLMNLKNPLPPKPASSKPSNPKSSTNSGLNWKKLMNLKNPLMPKPASSKPSNPKSSTNSGYNWKKLMNLKNPLPPKPASSKESGQAQESQPEVENVQQPNPGPSESADPADFDWTYWTNLEDPPPPKPASPKEFGQAHESQPEVENVQQPNPGLSNPGPSNPSLPTEPELHPDHQSLSTDSEMDDLQAAIYASKGKAKQLRRISGTARDIGNAA